MSPIACTRHYPSLVHINIPPIPPKYQAGDHIITEGTAGDEFFIIEEGQVVCTRSSE